MNLSLNMNLHLGIAKHRGGQIINRLDIYLDQWDLRYTYNMQDI